MPGNFGNVSWRSGQALSPHGEEAFFSLLRLHHLQCDTYITYITYTYITYITYISKDSYIHYVTLQCLTLLLKEKDLQILLCLNIIYFLFKNKKTQSWRGSL